MTRLHTHKQHNLLKDQSFDIRRILVLACVCIFIYSSNLFRSSIFSISKIFHHHKERGRHLIQSIYERGGGGGGQKGHHLQSYRFRTSGTTETSDIALRMSSRVFFQLDILQGFPMSYSATTRQQYCRMQAFFCCLDRKSTGLHWQVQVCAYLPFFLLRRCAFWKMKSVRHKKNIIINIRNSSAYHLERKESSRRMNIDESIVDYHTQLCFLFRVCFFKKGEDCRHSVIDAGDDDFSCHSFLLIAADIFIVCSPGYRSYIND